MSNEERLKEIEEHLKYHTSMRAQSDISALLDLARRQQAAIEEMNFCLSLYKDSMVGKKAAFCLAKVEELLTKKENK